jgi:hypothetical protein
VPQSQHQAAPKQLSLNMKEKLKIKKWQNAVIWIVGFLTFIAINVNTFGKNHRLESIGAKIGYLLDLLLGIGINILILWLIFKAANWIYFKIIQNRER